MTPKMFPKNIDSRSRVPRGCCAVLRLLTVVCCVVLVNGTPGENVLPKNTSISSQENLTLYEDDFNIILNNISKNTYLEQIKENEEKWHLIPWRKLETEIVNGIITLKNCSEENEESFPGDLFTDKQRQQGALILHFIGGIYSFTLLAVVCNDYFIPAVECICEDLKLTQDVAAATFMAVATSCPELFVNIMGTFVTKSDLGIGTIVGSAMFNTLGVGAIGGLAAIHPIVIKRWPVTRDCFIYSFNVAVLVTITWDGRIEWWESVILLCLYILYFILMFNNKRIYNFLKRLTKRPLSKGICKTEEEISGSKIDEPFEELESRYTCRVSVSLGKIIEPNGLQKNEPTEIFPDDSKIRKSLWAFPHEKTMYRKIWYIITWPLKLILTLTIPSPKTWRTLYPISFIMCIVWIGVNSYFVSWMMTTIGTTLSIPDSIMGMTFLAFGGCLPEACSIFIMSRKGQGGMGVSNSLGANSLAILFSLGIPWFIKCMILRSEGKDNFIKIESNGMDYIILSLIFAVIFLYIVLTVGKFYLRKTTGVTILMIYFIFIILAILVEYGVFFQTTLPQCTKI